MYKARRLFDHILLGLVLIGISGCSYTNEVLKNGPDAYVESGFKELAAKNYDAASDLFHRALEMDSKAARAYLGLGKLWMAKDAPFRAQLFFRRASQIDPDLEDVFCYLGDIYLEKNEVELALDFYDKCSASESEVSLQAHFNLGKYYLKERKINKARAEFNKCLQDSCFWGGFVGMGLISFQEEDYNTAMEHFKRANTLADEYEIDARMARAFDKLGQEEEALLEYSKWIMNEEEDDSLPVIEDRYNSLKNEIVNRYLVSRHDDIDVDKKITFKLLEKGNLKVCVYDLEGTLIKRLYSGFLTTGDYDMDWDGRSDDGQKVEGGLYLGSVEGTNVFKVEPLYINYFK